MIRLAFAIVVVGSVASADAPKSDPPPPEPDPLAEEKASEANLESNAVRTGMTFSAALGGGLVFGHGDVGRGPSASFRMGHVATPHTVITFEISGGSLLHDSVAKTLLHDDNIALMAGAQYYAAPSLWIRGAGGLATYTAREQMGTDPETTTAYPGIGGLVGVGIDLVRWRHVALELEGFTIAAIAHGFTLSSSLCLGLSYY